MHQKHLKHVRVSALVAIMLVTAVVSGAIVYTLEHDLFENALQQNYALYQKEFANQKLALDTLRLRQQVEEVPENSDFGAFCSKNKALLPKSIEISGGNILLNSTIVSKLILQAGNQEKIVSNQINLYEGLADVTLSTTSAQTVGLVHVVGPEEGLDGIEFFHYVETKTAKLTTITASTLKNSTHLEITDPQGKIYKIEQNKNTLTINSQKAYTSDLPNTTGDYTLHFIGINSSLNKIYFSHQSRGASEIAANKQRLLYFDLTTKKIITTNNTKDAMQPTF